MIANSVTIEAETAPPRFAKSEIYEVISSRAASSLLQSSVIAITVRVSNPTNLIMSVPMLWDDCRKGNGVVSSG